MGGHCAFQQLIRTKLMVEENETIHCPQLGYVKDDHEIHVRCAEVVEFSLAKRGGGREKKDERNQR